MIPPEPPDDSDVPVSGVVPVSLIAGDDDRDTKLLQGMAAAADEYIRSFGWCGSVSRAFYAGGVGGIFAIFLFDIVPTRSEIDRWIWIMVGDIPPAYLPLADAKSARGVFKTYIQGMMRWVQLAREGKEGTSQDGVPPVNVPATPEWAAEVEKRLHAIRLIVEPFFEDEGTSAQVH